jgi:hypothetical protein
MGINGGAVKEERGPRGGTSRRGIRSVLGTDVLGKRREVPPFFPPFSPPPTSKTPID